MKYELPLSIRQLTGCDTFEQIEKYILTMKQYAELGEKVVNEVDRHDSIINIPLVEEYIAKVRLAEGIIKLVNELNRKK